MTSPRVGDLRRLIISGERREARKLADALCGADVSEAFYLSAVLADREGEHEKAAGLYEDALVRLPGRSDIHYNYGVCLKSQNRTHDARAQWKKAVEFNPGHRDALFNLARLSYDAGDFTAAINGFSQIIRQDPRHGRALFNRGNAFYRMNRLHDALTDFENASARIRDDASLLINLGLCQQRLGQFEAACETLEKAARMDPGSFLAQWNKAQTLLCLERWEDGYRAFEARRRLLVPPLGVEKAEPWTGQPVEGKSVCVYAEQGQGDTIQFVRYLAALRERCRRVEFVCPPSLARLLAGVSGADGVHSSDVPRIRTRTDFHVPLMSLPLLLGKPSPSDSPPAPYLERPDIKTPAWPPEKIGLVWRGNPEHRADAERSMPLSFLKPLINGTSARWVSLQMGGAGEISVEGLAGKLDDWSEGLRDYADTAKLMAKLDLTISVDTSAAHLSGAMGLTTWIVLPFVADWRWGQTGGTTPWYPATRLFRQEAPSDWESAVKQMVDALYGPA